MFIFLTQSGQEAALSWFILNEQYVCFCLVVVSLFMSGGLHLVIAMSTMDCCVYVRAFVCAAEMSYWVCDYLMHLFSYYW